MVHHEAWPPERLAKWIAVLVLITMVAGGFGEAYVPSKLIAARDPLATATNVLQSHVLFRLGFASYVIEGLCDAALTALLYLLLKPAGRELALIAAFFRIVSTAAFASAQTFYFAALPILKGAPYLQFPPGQLDSLALISLKFSVVGGMVPTLFYGVSWMVLGYLIYVSRYLPKWLGMLMAFAGACFVVENFGLILAPAYSSDLFLAPMAIAMLVLAGWLVIRGVDGGKWRERTAIAG
ncbi:MAG: DUF4386 domain-containing protein [Alphaproteobacteria bacterium]|nr:DUF4386 domain-containing protein [Alphaproteobacteria bacterium]